MNSVNVNKLDFSFGEKSVLQNLNVVFQEHSMTGILGPNGSGKTTLLRIILKHLQQQKGTVFLKGDSLSKIPLKTLAKTMAYLAQSSDKTFSYTVEEYVLLGRYPHIPLFGAETKKDYSIVENAMALTDVMHLRNEDIRTVSGGEAQRIAFAQALAQEPEILILDEPTNHLDLQHQIRILCILRKLIHDKGITVISVMHDINLALEFCDTIALLHQGSMYHVGKPADVITRESIEKVYHIDAAIMENPQTKKPFMIPSYK